MKPAGIVLIILGVIAGILAFVAPVLGAGAAINTVNTTDTTTYVEGTMTKLLNPGKLLSSPTNPYDTDVPFKQTRVTKANQEAMSQQAAKDAGATIFDTTATTVRTDSGETLTASGAVYAFDPANSNLQNCCGAKLVATDTAGKESDVQGVNFSGIMPLKFPFGAPQGDLQYFDDTIAGPATAKYAGEESQYGLTMYKYTVDIPPTKTPAAPLAVPAGLAKAAVGAIAPELADKVPAEGNLNLYEWYTAHNEYWVEPLSGQIVNGTSENTTTFRVDGADKDVLTKVSLKGGSTGVEANAADIKSSADQLKMVGMATPILLGLGVLLLIIGIVLLVMGGKRKKAKAAAAAGAANQ